MNSLQEWGLEMIRILQKALGPFSVVPMKAITFLGSEAFAIAALPLLYWCVDRKKGARIGILVLFSAFVNLKLKYSFMEPRPYELDPSVGLAVEETPSFPSGHAQSSITFWGGMLSVLPRRLGWIAFTAITVLVGLSRVYLGVHYPTDVFASWGIGAVLLALYYLAGPRIEAVLHRWELRFRIIAAAAIALGMNYLLPNQTMISGAFLGSSIGFALASKRLRFDAKGSLKAKALRYLAGMIGTLAIYLGPKLLLSDVPAEYSELVRFTRYALVGAWASLGAPWLFLKLRLVALELSPPDDTTGSSE